MILIRLKGGLGNQMFQYAFATAMQCLTDETVKLEMHSLLNRSKGDFVYRDYDLPIFNVNMPLHTSHYLLKSVSDLKIASITQLVEKVKLKGFNKINEPHFHYSSEVIKPQKGSIYDGWWQSHLYFKDVEESLRKDFTFTHPILEKSKKIEEAIRNSNSICLNVRRTDFLNNETLNSTNLNYFLRGIDYIKNRIDDPHFFIFSDDIEWCRNNLAMDMTSTIVDHSHKGYKFGNYLNLMSQCDHFIIPNSSFAYWAVWLRNNKNGLVIAPENWFTDNQYDTSDLVRNSWYRC